MLPVTGHLTRRRRNRTLCRAAAGLAAGAALGIGWSLLAPSERTVYGPTLDATGRRCAFQLSWRWEEKGSLPARIQMAQSVRSFFPAPAGAIEHIVQKLMRTDSSQGGTIYKIQVSRSYDARLIMIQGARHPQELPEGAPFEHRPMPHHMGRVTVLRDGEMDLPNPPQQHIYVRTLAIVPDGEVSGYEIMASCDASRKATVRADIDRLIRTVHMVPAGEREMPDPSPPGRR